MRRSPLRLVAVLIGALLAALPATAGGWEKAGVEDGVVIYNRDKEGSDVKEVKAIGTINAPNWVVKNVVDDVANYKDFMPYTKVSTLKKGKGDSVITYQYLEMPLVSNRDYTLRITDKSFVNKAGQVVYKNVWTPANHLGPKPKDGAVRLNINDGYWVLEPIDGGKKTKATYYVYTNPGGSIPSWIANRANFQAIPALFDAVKSQSKKAKYKKTKPTLTASVQKALDAQKAPAPAPQTAPASTTP